MRKRTKVGPDDADDESSEPRAAYETSGVASGPLNLNIVAVPTFLEIIVAKHDGALSFLEDLTKPCHLALIVEFHELLRVRLHGFTDGVHVDFAANSQPPEIETLQLGH